MAREGKAPAFQFYAADWLADEDVRAMSLAERGAYIDLLAFCWREGSIPDDAQKCGRLIGATPREMADVWSTVRARFVQGNEGRLVSRRMEEQRGGLVEFKGKAGNGGRVVASRMTPEERSERARKAALSKHAAASEQANRKQDSASDACDGASGLLAAANTASASASASANTPLPPASGGGTRAEVEAAIAALVATPKRAGLMHDGRLVEAVADLAFAASPDDPADYATRAVDAFDAYRLSCKPGKQPGWTAEAFRRHLDTVQRVVAGEQPRPEPWAPDAPTLAVVGTVRPPLSSTWEPK